MIVYEVNLRVSAEIFLPFMDWLDVHIKQMLMFKGFYNAKLLREEHLDEDDYYNVTVHYFLLTRNDLDAYLENHADDMRADGVKKFPNKFTATRRIFEVTKEFTPQMVSQYKIKVPVSSVNINSSY